MRRAAAFIATWTLGASLLALGMVACGDDDTSVASGDAAADGASSSGNTSSSGGSTSSSGGSSSSSGGTGQDAGDGGDAAAATYAIGGKVTGLTGAGLVLQDNAGDDLPVSANGTFTFATRLAAGAAYAVTVKTQPANPTQTCTVSGGTGTVGKADITSIVVNCAAGQYTVGGTASGLTGTAVLKNNGGADLAVTANGTFAFPQTLTSGQTYDVTVVSSPPGQSCVVANGTGTIGAANVANVTLTCTTNTYAIGGTVLGLGSGSAIQLLDNGGDALVVKADGSFVFPTKLPTGASFAVTLASQPAGQTCTVSGGTGTVGTADVTSIVVNCANGAFTVGGTVSGLSGSLVLQNSGTTDLTVTANGGFAFPGTLPNGAKYDVTIKTPPTGQTCVVANGSGTISGANVTNVTITCTTNSYTIGGVVTGLSGHLVLQDNGGNNLALNASGGFTFTTPVLYGDTYNVTVLNQPKGQICTVTNGSGVVGASNVNNVSVTCVGTHSIGGTISGLVASSKVVLQDNGGDNLTLSANGAFTFATQLSEGQTYAVTVLTQPTGRTCTVTNGTGTVGSTNVTDVTVTCAP